MTARRLPRIVFPDEMLEADREQVRRRMIVPRGLSYCDMQLGSPPRVVRWRAEWLECPCGVMWRCWRPEGTPREVIPDSYKMCPGCDPDPGEMTPEQRVGLVHRLAHTDAVDHMIVALDHALAEGRTSESRWHNPADVAEIAWLRGLLDRAHGLAVNTGRPSNATLSIAELTASIRPPE